LTVDYRERTSAAGKFPGGFIKREGRPTTKEILTMRMIDRPVRPLFPKGYRNEVQIQTMVWSADQQNDPDILAMIGASASLAVSDIPFDGPIAAVRIGRVDDQFVINPTHDQLANSSLEIVLGGRRDQVNMIEVSAQELPEDVILDALKFGHKVISEICEMIADLARQCGKEKTPFKVFDTRGLMDMMEKKLGQE
jgi:polyribonucleotide nucleotidyltransferase